MSVVCARGGVGSGSGNGPCNRSVRCRTRVCGTCVELTILDQLLCCSVV